MVSFVLLLSGLLAVGKKNGYVSGLGAPFLLLLLPGNSLYRQLLQNQCFASPMIHICLSVEWKHDSAEFDERRCNKGLQIPFVR